MMRLVLATGGAALALMLTLGAPAGAQEAVRPAVGKPLLGSVPPFVLGRTPVFRNSCMTLSNI